MLQKTVTPVTAPVHTIKKNYTIFDYPAKWFRLQNIMIRLLNSITNQTKSLNLKQDLYKLEYLRCFCAYVGRDRWKFLSTLVSFISYDYLKQIPSSDIELTWSRKFLSTITCRISNEDLTRQLLTFSIWIFEQQMFHYDHKIFTRDETAWKDTFFMGYFSKF